MWIHEYKEWPNLTYDVGVLSSILATIRHKQGRLLGRMESLGFDLRQEANLNTLISDVVTSSAIEGEILNPEEVRSSIAKRLGIEVAGLIPTSRSVDGIVEMMLDATQNYFSPLIEERLFNWHAALFPTGRSGMNRITVADWRSEESGAMQVISGPIGNETVHFEAPEASRLSAEMSIFLTWLETSNNIDPVLKSGIAHLWFVTIHPFEDGNGRIARAIADMLLARSDGTADRFYSMSRQIEKERKDYYNQLERQQKTDTDITEWLNWFLECLGRAIDGAEEVLATVLYKAKIWESINQKPLNERQKLILNRMLDDFKGHMSTSKYAQLVKCSNDTALRDITELVAWRVFLQNPGSGRSTSYRLTSIDDLLLK